MISGNLSEICDNINTLVFTELSNYIDQYDVTLDVCLSSANQQAYVLNQMVSFICYMNNQRNCFGCFSLPLLFYSFSFPCFGDVAKDTEDRCLCG